MAHVGTDKEQICIRNTAYCSDDGSHGPGKGEYPSHTDTHQHGRILIVGRSSHGNADFGVLKEQEKSNDKDKGAAEYPYFDGS